MVDGGKKEIHQDQGVNKTSQSEFQNSENLLTICRPRNKLEQSRHSSQSENQLGSGMLEMSKLMDSDLIT